MRNNSTAPNAIIYKDELERSTTGIITRAQALQASSKTNAREYTTAKFKTLATTYRLEMMPILEIIQTPQTLVLDTTEVARLPPQSTKILQLLPCLA